MIGYLFNPDLYTREQATFGFLKLRLIEGAAGVGGRFVDQVDGEILECAAVLHDALLGFWLAVAVVERTRPLYPLQWRRTWVRRVSLRRNFREFVSGG